MNAGLSLDLFFSAANDIEQAQYRVLYELKTIREAFSNNIIYPHLGRLITLRENLQSILANLDEVRGANPGDLTAIDADDLSLEYDGKHLRDDNITSVEAVIGWALPLIHDAIEEGRTIFEFVEENLMLEEVGIVPAYTEEGYVLVPDRCSSQLHVLQYKLSIFSGKDDSFRSLRTTHVDSIDTATIFPDPTTVKLSLLREFRDLPNPATYAFVTDLDFPYENTLLPVAKRKLMRYLYGKPGLA